MKQETSPLPEEEGQGIAEEGPRATGTPEDRLRVPVVGIGASAGGLEALSALVAGLDPEPPQAYVVLQHVSPEHRSMLVDILSRDTALTVEAMTDGTVPRPGRVYVVPATSVATVRDGRFALNNATPDATPKPSINEFLASLASEAEEMAVGVVLSGTGSDGTAGLRAIQAAGGVTLVQQPETAKYPGMPMSAIEAGVADYLLPPEEIAQRLGELARLHATRDNGVPREFLDRLMAMVQSHRQIDFSEYKASTLARRVKRRVVATGAENPEDYLRWAEDHPEELNLLIRDILISVTAFFRDAEAFQALDGVIDRICAAKGEGEEIRLWVAGCATGEEAYSIAIQLAEAMRNQGRINPVQVFATDIDDEALEVARRGVYPAAALDKVPRHLVERYFRPLRDNQEVGKQLRDMVVFARHNLVDDPPFLRTDLVTCRNVLIYFDATLQAKVLRRFHFSLMEGGYLFLGRSESAAAASDHFDTLNRRESIYRKREEAEDTGNRQWLAPQQPKRPATSPQQQRKQAAQVMLETLASRFGATVALCDEDGNIQHTAGNIESFFRFPRGDMRMTLGDVLVEPFRGEAVAILYRLEQDEQTSQRGQAHEIDGVRYRLSVERQTQHAANHLLLVIAPVAESVAVSAGGELPDADTDPETLDAVAQNRALVEQLATANEEMQSLNEEAQASNEELQATNEELEAANEELQASNEELVSVNEELNVKASELTALTEEYQHLYDSMGFPVLVFDRLCYLRRFNREAQDRFQLKSTALGQPLSGLDLPTYFAGLADHLSQALAHGGTREEQISAGERQHFKLQVTPGLDQAGEVELLVVALMDVSDVVRVEEELEAYRQRLQSLMENTTILLAMKDLRGRYVYANPRFLEVFELDPATYEGRTDFELFPRSFAAELWARDVEAMQSDDSIDVEHILGGDDAPERIFHTVHQPMRDEEGHPVMLITESEEVTQRKRAEEQLRIAARVFENAGEAIVVTDETGGVQSINNAFTRITGYTEKDALGRNLGRLLKSGRHSKLFYNEMWKSLNENGCWQGEIWNRRKDGEIYPEWLSINRIDDENDLTQHFVAVFSDISSLKNNQRKVEYLANHDVLTGLPNRSLFQDRLDQAIALAQRNGSEVALLFVDLDNFKSINDTLGHDVGDELLVQVAARLQEVLREVDTVARVGGDEFTVILAECDRSGAAEVAQRIIDGVSGHFPVQGRDLVVGASLGMAFYPQDGEDGKTLAKAADTAMYQSKEDGRNQFQTFRAELHEQLLARTNLEEALRRALREDELRLVYQPKFALDGSGAIVGAEALLRWHTPGRGAISPGEFIPVAEQSRLIVDLSYHVEELLVAQIQAWREAGLEPPPVAFNVSAKCFRERGYAEQLFGRLERSGVPLAGVQIEITEGTFLEQSEHIDTNIARLQEAGIALSIDDFGTGFSSLTNLKKLPVREIKIDKTFVDGLGSDENDEAIARASLAMARALGVRTVAEGVETTGQQNWLREQGCDHVQGFLLARPLEAADFVELLRARTAS